MVGVPGKSKGCVECRRRKKACSLTRPVCDLCKRLSRVCNYDRDTIFITSDQTTWNTARYSGQSTNTSNLAEVPNTSTKYDRVTLTGEDFNTESQEMSLLPASHTLFMLAVRDQLWSNYLEMSRGNSQLLTSWITLLNGVPNPRRPLESSAFALCTSRLSRTYGDMTLKRESLRLYTLGVQQLHLALRKPEAIFDDEILATCVALAVHEIMEGGRSAYSQHADGAAHLIRLRGPERHISGLGHKVFVRWRLPGILRSMEVKEPSFYARKEWLEVPWQIESKSIFEQLVDIVTEAPALLARGEALSSMSVHLRAKEGLKLFKDCEIVVDRLTTFSDNLVQSSSSPIYWLRPEDDGLPIRYNFANVDIAACLILIWASSLMVKSGMHALVRMFDQLLAAGALGSDAVPSAGGIDDLPALARKILLSVEYCVANSTNEVRTPVILAPLGIVVDVLRNWPQYQDEYHAAREALKQMSQHGFTMVWPPVGE